jgi:molecular chaperone HtpG
MKNSMTGLRNSHFLKIPKESISLLRNMRNSLRKTRQIKIKALYILYSNDKDAQHSFIENAKNKGYDVLMMDGQLDAHFINHIEQKFKDSRFSRVDADVIDKLILKEDREKNKLTDDQKSELTGIFESQIPEKANSL